MASNEILDSWEDFQDYDAPKSAKTKKSKPENSNDSNEGVIVTEDTHRTQYKPQIRILKREPKDSKRKGHDDPSSSNGFATTDNPGDTKPKGKTLAQREAEYAEARRRILGPSYNPQEQPTTTTTSIQPPIVPPFPPPPPVPSLADLVPPYPPPPILPNHINPPPSTSGDDDSPRRLAQRMDNLKLNPGVVVVRQPNGPDPDGTRGFANSPGMRR